VAELAQPGPFLALTNGDTESHNFPTGPGGGRLIDFEGAGFRHALTAAAGFAVPGLLWLAVSGSEQVAAFRRALTRTVAEAEDDQRFGWQALESRAAGQGPWFAGTGQRSLFRSCSSSVVSGCGTVPATGAAPGDRGRA
jgi:hypothetical protein